MIAMAGSIYCRILRWLRDEEEQLNAKSLPKITILIVDMSRERLIVFFLPFIFPCYQIILIYIVPYFAAVIDIDTSGIHAFEELYKSLQKQDVQVSS